MRSTALLRHRCSTATSIMIDSYGTGKLSDNELTQIVRENFDLRPAGIIKMLDLRRPIYKQTAALRPLRTQRPRSAMGETRQSRRPEKILKQIIRKLNTEAKYLKDQEPAIGFCLLMKRRQWIERLQKIFASHPHALATRKPAGRRPRMPAAQPSAGASLPVFVPYIYRKFINIPVT